MAPVERDDWTDRPPTEVPAPIEKPSDGRIQRPDWTENPRAPVGEAPVDESSALDLPAGAPGKQDEGGKVDRPDWTGEEDAQSNAPDDTVSLSDIPDSAFADPADVGDEMAPAIDAARAILKEDASWKDTVENFTQSLSPAAQNVLVAEMAAAPDMDAPPLTDAQAEAFRNVPEAAELWQEWGDAAPEKAAMARARLDRLILSLPEHEVATFDKLMNQLPPAAYREVLRQLAEG